VQQEVRFLRAPGEAQEVTLGWDLGDPPHHIMLDHPSIQPRHARMRYLEGQWWIESLAEYHPVEVNDVPLHLGDEPALLQNGDQVRLGEALFRFHMS
jgi:pSer/pThr/pTyr-binding forkhead associated (FHA) protein